VAANRFADLLRPPTMVRSRRGLARALAALGIGGAIGAAAPATGEAKRCPPCRKKKNGTCRKKKPDGTRCGDCRACRNGRCVPNGDLDDSACGRDGRCLAGTCNEKPDCSGTGETCAPKQCCSAACSEFCLAGAGGRPCLDGQDCISGSCRGYRCT
jgi:hypothetical protein